MFHDQKPRRSKAWVWSMAGGAALIGYAFFVASQDSGTYYFPAAIFDPRTGGDGAGCQGLGSPEPAGRAGRGGRTVSFVRK